TPTIAGTTKVGETLTATAGTWGPDPIILSYQWFAGDSPIAGATGTTLALDPALVAQAITVAVTGTKPGGFEPVTRTSAATPAVVAGTLTSPVPTISGTAQVGETLT